MSNGLENDGYVNDEKFGNSLTELSKNKQQNGINNHQQQQQNSTPIEDDKGKPREKWSSDLQFLMSCIAMSVGLGNVWRFPFTALENGGGAFLIPYLIVLIVIGKPIYYLEMIIGQLSSRGSIKVFDLSPAMRGIGHAQFYVVFLVATYYASIMALIGRYLVDSFKNPLPWSYCRPTWNNCLDSNGQIHGNISGTSVSSSEIYFVKEILKERDSLEYGIGIPDWSLGLCLLFAWTIIVITLVKGVQSSGKASYFLALFPYVILLILLVRSITLPGSSKGILYFITPQWEQLARPQVWYAAITQCFFSLSVSFGNITMYSSFNKINHNIHRDSTIVTIMDTFTSMLAGVTIFGIIGHLAHQLGTDNIDAVIKGGPGIAFISYPDAIARFEWVPQVFAVLFFFMLFVLGIGCNVAMATMLMTSIRDKFPRVKHWQAGIGIGIVGIAIGIFYITEGGQYLLTLVDYFGVSLIAMFVAVAELITISWIYGVKRICKDVEFMLNRKTGIYWRLCWGIVTPLLIFIVLVYMLVTYEPVTYNGYIFPSGVYAVGWTLTAFGVIQIPIWMIYTIIKQKEDTWLAKVKTAFKPKSNWGPIDPIALQEYQFFISNFENHKLQQINGKHI